MKELKCPRCKNEELKGNENYCPICGLDLEEKTAQEVPVQEQLIKVSVYINKGDLSNLISFNTPRANIEKVTQTLEESISPQVLYDTTLKQK